MSVTYFVATQKFLQKPLDHDVTSCFILSTERRKHLDRRLYHTGQFAQKAAVSIRTLRYYDRIGLLSPTQHTESGYRLYSDADFVRLQQILALKFLGFSLEEIERVLGCGPGELRDSLAQQRAMLAERRSQIDAIIRAIDETDGVLQGNGKFHDKSGTYMEAIVHIIQVMHMTQTNDWRKKYLTEEQLQQLDELSKASYTEEDRQKLAEWGKNFTEQDQQRATQQWNEVLAEVRRLSAVGADPAGAEAQALAGRYLALINEFTRGDPGITSGLKRLYQNMGQMPAEQRPLEMPYTSEGEKFIQQAVKVYQERGNG